MQRSVEVVGTGRAKWKNRDGEEQSLSRLLRTQNLEGALEEMTQVVFPGREGSKERKEGKAGP